MIDPDQIDDGYAACRCTEAVAVEVEDELVIYHKELETIHILNPSAAVVWGALDGDCDIGTLASQFAEAFAVNQRLMTEQVLKVVRDFGRQGLLEGVAADEQTIRDSRLDLLRAAEGVEAVRDE